MPRSAEQVFPTRKSRTEDRRKEGSDRKLLDEFFDHPTLIAISRLVNQGQFDAIDYPISTGKEGGVFRASSAMGYKAVKVYRIGNAIFRRIPPYALEELKREASERNFSRLVFAWTRREHSMLRKLRAAEVRVPEPYGYLRNVLVMEFIGTEGLPAPRLRDAVIPDPKAFYEDLVVQMRRMTVDAKLVHGDLSPFNVLLDGNAPVLIDVAQSIASDHPQARALFERDTMNFAKYLRKMGMDVSDEELFRAAGGEFVGPKA
ncbi:MAG: serine protein kinase RIO [Thermoplasmata archaeon]|nr:serine protein kinase RIO [Thermoplasmata archaeon]MCI4354468.1 serine protein kinase RIO [Thermoplasmata archaeon]